MAWWLAATVLFGAFTALFAVGLPAAVAFLGINILGAWVRLRPGRRWGGAVGAGAVFPAISGATIATPALLGSLLLPEMLRRGYHPNMAMGPIMAIGGVDMLIPPAALTGLP